MHHRSDTPKSWASGHGKQPLALFSWLTAAIIVLGASPLAARHRTGATAASGYTNAKQSAPLALHLGHHITRLATVKSGGILLHNATKTVIYPQFPIELSHLDVPTRETIIVVGTGSSVESTFHGRKFGLSEPGALLFAAEQPTLIKAHGPHVFAVTCAKPPTWYEKLHSYGPTSSYFNALVELNASLLSGASSKVDQFSAPVLSNLLQLGLLKHEPAAPYVAWDPLLTPAIMHEKLAHSPLSSDEQTTALKRWAEARQRGLSGTHGGLVSKERFHPHPLAELLTAGLLYGHPSLDGTLAWKACWTESAVVEQLKQLTLNDHERSAVLEIWRTTTRAGFNNSGIVHQQPGLTAVLWRDRIDPWTHRPSEWIVASDLFVEGSDPFVVGLSAVHSPNATLQPFSEIRPTEALHVHPKLGLLQQDEGYFVLEGYAALLFLRKRQPWINLMHAGDIAVIPAGIPHQMLAVQGPYLHVALQVPSTFHFGFKFKQPYELGQLGLTTQALLEQAQAALAARLRGPMAL